MFLITKGSADLDGGHDVRGARVCLDPHCLLVLRLRRRRLHVDEGGALIPTHSALICIVSVYLSTKDSWWQRRQYGLRDHVYLLKRGCGRAPGEPRVAALLGLVRELRPDAGAPGARPHSRLGLGRLGLQKEGHRSRSRICYTFKLSLYNRVSDSGIKRIAGGSCEATARPSRTSLGARSHRRLGLGHIVA